MDLNSDQISFRPTNTDDSATDAAHKPITTTTNTYPRDTDGKSSDGTKSNETPSNVNAATNIKTSNTQA